MSRRAIAHREQRWEEFKAIIGIALAVLAFMLAGTLDYQDERAQAERWEERGITIATDW
jgi:hypothetical protein